MTKQTIKALGHAIELKDGNGKLGAIRIELDDQSARGYAFACDVRLAGRGYTYTGFGRGQTANAAASKAIRRLASCATRDVRLADKAHKRAAKRLAIAQAALALVKKSRGGK